MKKKHVLGVLLLALAAGFVMGFETAVEVTEARAELQLSMMHSAGIGRLSVMLLRCDVYDLAGESKYETMLAACDEWDAEYQEILDELGEMGADRDAIRDRLNTLADIVDTAISLVAQE